VSAALIIVKDDGRVELVNRSARSLAGEPVDRLEDVKAIGAPAAAELLALRPGTRQIINLTAGRQMFVSVSQLSSPEQGRRRMLSLHAIAGELDAVELKAWKDMAGVLAHEIMNSLTAIASLSESLNLLLQAGRGPTEDAEVAGALEAINRRSLGLMDFVERYRLVMDTPAPAMQEVRLDELLTGIERLMGPGLADRGVILTLSIRGREDEGPGARNPGGAPPRLSCRADPRLLEQALINLLKNAVEAVSDADQPRIEVVCEQHEDSVVVTVTDNGCGLKDAGDPSFVPAFTTKAGGSGVGLNLVRQIALSHGGQLDAQRNHPRGSRFILTLPDAALERLPQERESSLEA
jgi:C4-dicarboxylate-specific signal transduction histidine kinase